VSGKVDDLNGLKENVIVGHRIPAGTGLKEYQNVIVGSKKNSKILIKINNLKFEI
jgi:DNA-directed RNA polymerase subunit beta'